jgi:hypothetical protein
MTTLSSGLEIVTCFFAFSVAVLYFRPLSNSSSSASNALRPRNDLKKLPYLADECDGGVLVADLNELLGTYNIGYCSSDFEREGRDGIATAGVALLGFDDDTGVWDCSDGAVLSVPELRVDLVSMARRLSMLSIAKTGLRLSPAWGFEW